LLALAFLAHAAMMLFICCCLQEAERAKVVAQLGGWQVAADLANCVVVNRNLWYLLLAGG
jgi:hypothetical protein